MPNLKTPVNENDHHTGNINAHVTLVEYGDYECPYCGRAHPLIKRLLKERGAFVHFVFRNFPLQEIHRLALPAALAAEAAGVQGKFWEMHDLIFDNQDNLSMQYILALVRHLKLDEREFQKSWQDTALLKHVEMDFESGVRSGVNGTPTFFVNGNRLNTYDETYSSLLRAISTEVF
jgi:protein-disulfide isomerase